MSEYEQTIYYHILELDPGIYEIHLENVDEPTGIVQVSENGYIYDYETKERYEDQTLYKIAEQECTADYRIWYQKIS